MAEELEQFFHALVGFLYSFGLPNGIQHLFQRGSILSRSRGSILLVLLIQRCVFCLFCLSLFHQVYQSTLRIILTVDFFVYCRIALCRRRQALGIYGHGRIAFSTCKSAVDFILHSLEYLFIPILGHQVIFDLDGLSLLNEFFKAYLVLIRQITVLATLEQFFDLCIHRVKSVNICLHALRQPCAPRLFSLAAQFLQGCPCAFIESLKGRCPLLYDLIRFFFPI